MFNYLACAIGGCGEDYTWLIVLIVFLVIILAILAYIIYSLINKKKNKK